MKQVEAELTDGLVLSISALYFVNNRVPAAINKDHSIEIKCSYPNLFYLNVLGVSFVDFVTTDNSGTKRSLADQRNERP